MFYLVFPPSAPISFTYYFSVRSFLVAFSPLWEMSFSRASLSLSREKFGSRSSFRNNKKASIIASDTETSCARHPRLWIFRNNNWMTFFSALKHVSPTHILGDNDLWYLFRLSLPLERADNMQKRRTFESFLSDTFPFPAPRAGPLYHAECQRCCMSIIRCVCACVCVNRELGMQSGVRRETKLVSSFVRRQQKERTDLKFLD